MAALGARAGMGVVAAAVGAMEPVSQGLHEILELGSRHPVEPGDAGDHPALAGREQQRPVAALPLVKSLQVVVSLAAPHPIPDPAGRRVGRSRPSL